MQLRRDQWNTESDKLVGDTVIRYIKNGGSQMDAFKEAANKLDRTAAAVGFRFNSKIRQTIEDKLKDAKTARLKLKRNENVKSETNNIVKKQIVVNDLDIPVASPREVTIESVMKDIAFLLEKNNVDKAMEEENVRLRARNQELELKLSEVNNVFNALKGLNMGN